MQQLWKQHGDKVRFAIVGLTNTTLDLLVYTVLTRGLVWFNDHRLVTKGLTFILITIFSFFANRRFTFRQAQRANWPEAGRFFLTTGSAVFINVGVMYISHNVLGIYDLFGLLIASGCTFLWSYSFSKAWVFRGA